MQFDLEGDALPHAYKILTALVTPRPIAWISTLSVNGTANLAPFSFFNVFGSKPPIVAITIGNRPSGEPKDTAQNILDTEEFVINIVPQQLAEPMARSAYAHPSETDESTLLNLPTSPSVKIKPQRLTDAPAALECRLYEEKIIGENRMIIGTVLHAHASEGLFDPSTLKFDQTQYHPVGRMASPNWYTQTQQLFQQDVTE